MKFHLLSHIDIKHTAELIWVKALLNLRSEASTNYLSYAWWLIEPLLHMLVYLIVFSLFLDRGGNNYVVFLLTGLIPWLWFARSITHAQHSIDRGKQLMNQLFIPKIFFPLTVLVQDVVKQCFVFLLLFVVLILYGFYPSMSWFWILPIGLVQILFTTGCALIAALLIPYARDFSLVIPTVLQFMMFGSGIFYRYTEIPERFHSLFFLNPMSVLLTAYRDILMSSAAPDLFRLTGTLVFSVILILAGVLIYRKLEYTLPRVVLE